MADRAIGTISSKEGFNTSYTRDGHQAYYFIKAGGEETWYTTALHAVSVWESLHEDVGAELWVKTSNGTQRVR